MPRQRNASRRNPAPDARLDRGAALIGRCVAHGDAHLDQVLDAPTLARQAAMSLHHFHRVFHTRWRCASTTLPPRRPPSC